MKMKPFFILVIPAQFDCKGDFEFSLQHPNLYS